MPRAAYFSFESSMNKDEVVSVRGVDKEAVLNLAMEFARLNVITQEEALTRFVNQSYCVMFWVKGSAKFPLNPHHGG